MCSASRLDIAPTYCLFVVILVTKLLDVISMDCSFFLIFTIYFYYVCILHECPYRGQL